MMVSAGRRMLLGVFVLLRRARADGGRNREDEGEGDEPHGYSIIMRSPCCGANR